MTQSQPGHVLLGAVAGDVGTIDRAPALGQRIVEVADTAQVLDQLAARAQLVDLVEGIAYLGAQLLDPAAHRLGVGIHLVQGLGVDDRYGVHRVIVHGFILATAPASRFCAVPRHTWQMASASASAASAGGASSRGAATA